MTTCWANSRNGPSHFHRVIVLTSINVGTRFDWSPHTCSLIIRMPSSTHDIFTELVVQEIWSQMKSIARRDRDVAAIVDQVRSESTSDVYLYGGKPINDRYPKHTPDASFAHADSQYPSIIIETSYSQQHKVLRRLADEYICGSDGNIAAILGLDIEYGVGSKEAPLSIWRPRVVPDPDEKKATILEMFSDQEADVMPSLLSHYRSKSVPHLMLMGFALAAVSCRRRDHRSRSRIVASAP